MGWRRARVRISADGLTYRFLLAAGGALSRRHAAHRARRRILADNAERKGPSDHHRSCCATSKAPKRRTTRPSWCASPTSAARDVPLFVAGLPIFSRAYYASRPFDETTLDIPLGSGPYKVGPLRGRPLHRIRAGRRTGGARSCRYAAARTISTPCATNITATAMSASKASPAKNYLFREEFTSRIWATRYDFPAIRDGRVKREDPARRYAVRRAGLVHQHAARQIQESGAARGADLRLRFRMDQQEHHVRVL